MLGEADRSSPRCFNARALSSRLVLSIIVAIPALRFYGEQSSTSPGHHRDHDVSTRHHRRADPWMIYTWVVSSACPLIFHNLGILCTQKTLVAIPAYHSWPSCRTAATDDNFQHGFALVNSCSVGSLPV
jgi:hypothetical protein